MQIMSLPHVTMTRSLTLPGMMAFSRTGVKSSIKIPALKKTTTTTTTLNNINPSSSGSSSNDYIKSNSRNNNNSSSNIGRRSLSSDENRGPSTKKGSNTPLIGDSVMRGIKKRGLNHNVDIITLPGRTSEDIFGKLQSMDIINYLYVV